MNEPARVRQLRLILIGRSFNGETPIAPGISPWSVILALKLISVPQRCLTELPLQTFYLLWAAPKFDMVGFPIAIRIRVSIMPPLQRD